MKAWAPSPDIKLIADVNGEFTKGLGMQLDMSEVGLGVRSRRYSAIIDKGEVVALNIEANPGEMTTTGADTILKQLDELAAKK